MHNSGCRDDAPDSSDGAGRHSGAAQVGDNASDSSSPFAPAEEPAAFFLAEVPAGAVDLVREFTFTANLLAQEATGNPDASVSESDVLAQLVGSDPLAPRSVLVVAVAEPVLGPVGPHGLSLLPEGTWRDVEALGFAHVILAQEDAEDLAAVEIVPGVDHCPPYPTPLDSEVALIHTLCRGADVVARANGRSRLQLFSRDDRFGPLLEADGFCRVHRELQGVSTCGGSNSAVVRRGKTAPDGNETGRHRLVVIRNLDVPESLVAGVCELFSIDDRDRDRGGLTVQPRDWDSARLRRTRERLSAEGTRAVAVLLVDDAAGGRALALAEAYRTSGSAPEIVEHGTTVVAPDYRGCGLGTTVTTALLSQFPAATRMYFNLSPDDAAAVGLAGSIGVEFLGAVTAYERSVRGR